MDHCSEPVWHFLCSYVKVNTKKPQAREALGLTKKKEGPEIKNKPNKKTRKEEIHLHEGKKDKGKASSKRL